MGLNKQERAAHKTAKLQKKREARRIEKERIRNKDYSGEIEEFKRQK